MKESTRETEGAYVAENIGGGCSLDFAMEKFLFTITGVALIAFVIYDVYAAILHARARSGPISGNLNRVLWSIARTIAFHLSRQGRHRLLNAVGPLLMPILVTVLIVILISGYALIYLPHMPHEFSVDETAISPAWIESLYFSGITLTTVGYGDITPHSTLMRFVALCESASGFVLISLAVTYLVTVYSALERKRAVALSFYHQADGGADVASFIAHHFVENRFVGLETTLRDATRDIQNLLESHIEHPVINYFHPIEVHKGMPRVLFIALEAPTIIHACLRREDYPHIYRHPEVQSLETSARYVLATLVAALGVQEDAETHIETPQEELRRWRHRWRQTMARLTDAGIVVSQDKSASWEEYKRQRREWEAQLYRFARYLGYDWDEVTGDRNLEYAADEEMEELEVGTMNAATMNGKSRQ